MLDVEYPEAALIAEWNGPRMSLKTALTWTFISIGRATATAGSVRNYDGMDSNPHKYRQGVLLQEPGTGIDKFLDEYLPAYKPPAPQGRSVVLHHLQP